MSDWTQPDELRGDRVALEALQTEHIAALESAARDGELWRLWFTFVPEPGPPTAAYVAEALDMRKRGVGMPFVVRDLASGEIVGSTRYCNIDRANHRLEIGYTWYAKSAQRSGINTECKLLLLSNAFENLDAIAVELRTHRLNRSSRRAIERLGAQQDGILRNHQSLADGTVRDTVVYSIIDSEWPTVKRGLGFLLERT